MIRLLAGICPILLLPYFLFAQKGGGLSALAWTELVTVAPDILVDIRYATPNNFMKQKVYDCGKCYLRPSVAKSLAKVQTELKKKGLGLKVFDCYRPKGFQQRLWDIKPNASYVTPPWKGSQHSRGAAVDLTLVDAHGKELDMGTPYDSFEKKAHFDYTNLAKDVLERRRLLRTVMVKYGFRGIRTEWWHFSYPGKYSLSDDRWGCNR